MKLMPTHSEDHGREALAKLIKHHYRLLAHLPRQGEVIEI
jgi:hypothetical protein